MVEFLFPEDALCRGVDPEIFWPMPGDTAGVEQAKAICARCPVRAQCLAFALGWGDTEDGIYGGLTGAERDALFRRTA